MRTPLKITLKKLKSSKMKKQITLIVLTFFAFNLVAQNDQLLKIFNDQVDAFNQRDVDRLANNVSDDFKWFYLTSDTLLLEVAGKENFKSSMEGYFSAVPQVFSSIEESSINGNRISFKEVVQYKNKKGETVSSSAMGIYEIREDKISRAWYFID